SVDPNQIPSEMYKPRLVDERQDSLEVQFLHVWLRVDLGTTLSARGLHVNTQPVTSPWMQGRAAVASHLDDLAVLDDAVYVPQCAEILQRIPVNHEKVGELASLDRTQRVVHAQLAGRPPGGRADHLEGRESSGCQILQLAVQHDAAELH